MKKIEYSEYEENTSRDDSVKEVMAAASNILVFADNTEKSLRDKLTRKGFNEEAIEAAKKAGARKAGSHKEV